jgi:PPOX class probable F420-dependent enzyme
MINLVPESHQDLLKEETKAFAFVATVKPDGSPHVTAVWFNTDGEHILFNTMPTTAKYRNVQENEAIALAIFEPGNPYRYLQVQGSVRTTAEGAVDHTHALSQKYTGKDFNMPEGTERRIFVVTPEHVTVWG